MSFSGLLLDRVDVALQLGAFVARRCAAAPRARPFRRAAFSIAALCRPFMAAISSRQFLCGAFRGSHSTGARDCFS